jgi:hypothetical protein
LVVELVVPYDGLESFVAVRRPPSDRMIWRDWCDYHAFRGTTAELCTYRAEDVEAKPSSIGCSARPFASASSAAC